MTTLTWDLTAILILLALSGAACLVKPLADLIMRCLQWHRLRHYSRCYLPHSHSDTPWKENVRR